MLEVILAALAGLLIGSFLNVCVYRLPRDLSVVRPRSYCPQCERTIPWYENIPLFSYLFLGGKCSGCKKRIPVRYLVLEVVTAAAFALSVAALGPTAAALKYCVFSALMIGLIASDMEERILPDEFTLGGTLIGLVFALFVPVEAGIVTFFLPAAVGPRWSSLIESGFAAAFSAGSIWFVAWLYEKFRHREGMGFGDVKMIAMIGAFMGLRWALLTLIAGSMLGSVAGLIYIFATKKDAKTYELPFGSFLGLAALLVAVWAQVVLRRSGGQ